MASADRQCGCPGTRRCLPAWHRSAGPGRFATLSIERDRAYSEDFMVFYDEGSFGTDSFVQNAKTHAEKVNQVANVLADQAADVGNPADNLFDEFYDESIEWSDVAAYIAILLSVPFDPVPSRFSKNSDCS